MARSLATGFITLGHDVKFGSRTANPSKLDPWIREHGNGRASASSFADAARFGELVVVATHGSATAKVLRSAGPANFAGKTVIDVTNPLIFTGKGPPTLFVGTTDSLGETVQRMLRRARVVKTFNTIGHTHMFRPDFPGGTPTMFVSGNNTSAKNMVTELLHQFGWKDVVDLGRIKHAREQESACVLWVTSAMSLDSWNVAISILRK